MRTRGRKERQKADFRKAYLIEEEHSAQESLIPSFAMEVR